MVLRYLYGFRFYSLPFPSGPEAQATYVLQVVITADKYGIDRKFVDELEKFFTRSVSEMKDPNDIMSMLKMCTIGSEIHLSL
jgi:hypothetical protein